MHPTRQPLMVANWKMFKTVKETQEFGIAFKELVKNIALEKLPDIVICPPFTAIYSLSEIFAKTAVRLGAQNMSSVGEGAFTGEVAPRMLTDVNVEYVILGHSERRQHFNETDADIHAKVAAALQNGLTPIVCVGESLTQREMGETDTWITQQVKAALQGFSEAERYGIVFAYEPIWAIGTGKVCESAEANRVIGMIRKVCNVPSIRILYGGSMNPDNVEGLMSQVEIDGGLVGGASLDPKSFFQLVKAAMPLKVQHA